VERNPNRITFFSPATIGLFSVAIVQLYAVTIYLLYKRVADQFSAFHICLERTNRYLIAYKIAKETQGNIEQTLRDLACIMAKAPMIPLGGMAVTEVKTKSGLGKIASAE
jgi:hypothetical protein